MNWRSFSSAIRSCFSILGAAARRYISKLKREFKAVINRARRRQGELLVVVPPAVFVLAFISVAVCLPEPATTVVANIHAEDVEIKVDDPTRAGVSLAEARVLPKGIPAATAPCSHDVEIRPRPDSLVIYHRPIGGPLSIDVEGSLAWKSSQLKAFVESRDFVAFHLDRECGFGQSVRLPITGKLNVGLTASVTRPDDSRKLDPAYPVLDGKLSVYGRSIESFSLLGWPLPGFVSHKLYLAEDISLPAGTRLIDEKPDPPCAIDPAYAVPHWGGFVDVDLTPNARNEALVINSATDASELLILAPAGPTNCPDTMSLTIGARLTSDPNLRWLFAIGSAGLVISTIWISLATYWQMVKRDEVT